MFSISLKQNARITQRYWTAVNGFWQKQMGRLLDSHPLQVDAMEKLRLSPIIGEYGQIHLVGARSSHKDFK